MHGAEAQFRILLGNRTRQRVLWPDASPQPRGQRHERAFVTGSEAPEWAVADGAARVHEDFMSGVRSGVNGTPTFYIDGVRYDDSYDLDTLLSALEQPVQRDRSGLGVT